MNEVRNLPINCVVLHSHCRYYVPLRLPPIRNTFRQAYTLSLYLSVMGKVPPVPKPHFPYILLPLYRGIPPCCFPISSHVPWFSPIYARLNFPLFSFQRPLFDDTAEFTLCYGLHVCSLLLSRLLYPLA